jgi:outer membrane beta-barrel protein
MRDGASARRNTQPEDTSFVRRIESAEGVVMKQARKWLPIAAALMLLPQAALAQKGNKKPAAPTPAPAAGGEIELDAPPTPAKPGAAAGVELDAPAAPAAPAAGATTGGICDIDPSACPKTGTGELAAAAKKDVNAEVYAVQQIYALRYHRLEIAPYWETTLNDQFVSHPGPGVDINFYITNVLAIGLNGNFYGGLNGDSDFNFEVRRSARVATPLNEYREGANFNFTYVPIYGKFAGFRKFIFHYDIDLVGGVGFIDTRPIAVIDPDDRSFQFKPKLDFDIGIGIRIFFNRWFAVNLEVRDYIYDEQLENTVIANGVANPTTAELQDQSTWYGASSITNNVQAQLGVSVFLPFSWEYRLPK